MVFPAEESQGRCYRTNMRDTPIPGCPVSTTPPVFASDSLPRRFSMRLYVFFVRLGDDDLAIRCFLRVEQQERLGHSVRPEAHNVRKLVGLLKGLRAPLLVKVAHLSVVCMPLVLTVPEPICTCKKLLLFKEDRTYGFAHPRRSSSLVVRDQRAACQRPQKKCQRPQKKCQRPQKKCQRPQKKCLRPTKT